jgi:hypothetical protein
MIKTKLELTDDEEMIISKLCTISHGAWTFDGSTNSAHFFKVVVGEITYSIFVSGGSAISLLIEFTDWDESKKVITIDASSELIRYTNRLMDMLVDARSAERTRLLTVVQESLSKIIK